MKEQTEEEKAAFKEKLKSLQFSSVCRTTAERALDRVIDMPRAEFERMKEANQ